MGAFEKFITLVTALLTLSLIAEKIIDWVKLYFGQKGKKLLLFSNRDEDISKKSDDPMQNAVRERKIIGLNIVLCALIALIMNANIFDLLSAGEPTQHLGWKNIRLNGGEAIRNTSEIFGMTYFIFYTLIGCTLSGFCMSLGSKFWHDLLDLLQSIKDIRKNKAMQEVKNVTPPQPDGN